MNLFPYAMIMSQDALTHELGSALPGAPVVADRPSRLPRARHALATALRRAAARIAPAPATAGCSPAH